MTWLEAEPGQDPVTLLGDLGRRLGLPESESGFTTVAQGRDKLAAMLRDKRMLVALDNVWERGPLDALTGLAPGCTVMFTTRRPELATTFGATEITVDELTHGQALELLSRWTGQADAELPPTARALCTRVGNLALGVAMAGAMVTHGRSFTDVAALIEQDLPRVHADLDPAYQYRNLWRPSSRASPTCPRATSKGTSSCRCSPGVPFPARPRGSCGGRSLPRPRWVICSPISLAAPCLPSRAMAGTQPTTCSTTCLSAGSVLLNWPTRMPGC